MAIRTVSIASFTLSLSMIVAGSARAAFEPAADTAPASDVSSGTSESKEEARAEKTKDSVETWLPQCIEAGPGVYRIKKDSDGRIISCVVVGQSRIGTALGAAKGLETARIRARNDVNAQFVKWIREDVKVVQRQSDETVILLSGSETDGEGSTTESGKAVEKNSQEFESVASGLVRGLQMVGREQSKDEKLYTVVMGWSVANAEATKDVEKANADGSADKGRSRGKDGGDEEGRSKDKDVENKRVIAPGADDF